MDNAPSSNDPPREPVNPNLLDPSLLAISQAIASNLDLDKVLETILSLTLREMHAQEGSILLYNPASEHLEMLAQQGLPEEVAARGYVTRRGSIAEWVVGNNKPVILNGTAQGSNYSAIGRTRVIHSALCVPLCARGAVLGTINLNRTDPSPGLFEEVHLQAMLIIAAQAAISIDNARLYESNLRRERMAAVGQVAAGLSHCIKNLVTTLMGGMGVIERARAGEDWQMFDSGISILRRSVSRVSGLAMDMLDYAKDRSPIMREVDVADLVAEIVEMTAIIADRRGIGVTTGVAEDARRVMADGDQIFRALLNLVENGLEASPDGGTLEITAEVDTSPAALKRLTRPAPRALVIRVLDSGSGVDEENRDKIFEALFSTKGSKGTGLGLSISRKMIVEHGGALDLLSEPGDPGLFGIFLPLE